MRVGSIPITWKSISAGMVVHFCNPSTWRHRQNCHKFKASLGYVLSSRPFSTTCENLSQNEKEFFFSVWTFKISHSSFEAALCLLWWSLCAIDSQGYILPLQWPLQVLASPHLGPSIHPAWEPGPQQDLSSGYPHGQLAISIVQWMLTMDATFCMLFFHWALNYVCFAQTVFLGM